MDGQSVAGVLFMGMGVVVLFMLLLLGRELVTWYWKVNEGLERLRLIESCLRNIDSNLIIAVQVMQQPTPRPIPRDEPGAPS